MSYGVSPQGFNRARLPELLAEIEETARGIWGQGVVQTAQSPLGQLNGLVAKLSAALWEAAEDTYQSFDVDQAEGIRLGQLGRLRLLERIDGELDPAYRQAITNADRARFDLPDVERAAASVPSVSWVRAYATGRCSDVQGMPSRCVSVAVIGGDDGTIAEAIRPHVVPGVDSYGNTRVDLLVDGYCRTYFLVRPVMMPVGLDLTVRLNPDALGCPPPSTIAVAEAIADAFTGAGRPANGADLTLHLIRTIVARTFPNVEVLSGAARRLPDTSTVALPLLVPFLSMLTLSASDVAITAA